MSAVEVPDCIPLRKHPTSIPVMVRAVAALMEPFAAEAKVTLGVGIDDGVPSLVTVDEDKIAWVLGTLIGNALRHVPKRSTGEPRGKIVVHVSAPAAGMVAVSVSDNGPGIPQEKLVLLFQPAPYQRRLGYGLVLAREIVVAHGGRLEIDSALDPQGVTVRIVLPATP